MRRLWPIDGDDRFQIPDLLKRWGYPRDLTPGELAISWWYGIGRDGLLWYNSADGDPPHSAMFHTCFAPGTHPTRREFTAVELIAEIRGLHLLITAPPTERLRCSLLRLGWEVGKDDTVTRDLRDGP